MAKKKNTVKQTSEEELNVIDNEIQSISDIKNVELEDSDFCNIPQIDLNLDKMSEELFNDNDESKDAQHEETKEIEKNQKNKNLIQRMFGYMWNGQIYG